MTSYTNRTKGPKAIHTTDKGVVILQPGQSEDLNVSEANAKAMGKAKLLDGDANSEAPSLAAMQMELASQATPDSLTGAAAGAAGGGEGDDGLPAADDPDVVALRDGSNATELQKIATDEKVDMAGVTNKTDAARRIIAARRATPPPADGGPDLPAADDAEVAAMVDGNDEPALRQLAEVEKVAVTADDDKTDIARKIIAARRA